MFPSASTYLKGLLDGLHGFWGRETWASAEPLLKRAKRRRRVCSGGLHFTAVPGWVLLLLWMILKHPRRDRSRWPAPPPSCSCSLRLKRRHASSSGFWPSPGMRVSKAPKGVGSYSHSLFVTASSKCHTYSWLSPKSWIILQGKRTFQRFIGNHCLSGPDRECRLETR